MNMAYLVLSCTVATLHVQAIIAQNQNNIIPVLATAKSDHIMLVS